MNENLRIRIATVGEVLAGMTVTAKKAPEHNAKSIKNYFSSWIKSVLKGSKVEASQMKDVKLPRGGFDASAIIDLKVTPKKKSSKPIDISIRINWVEDSQYSGTMKVGTTGPLISMRGPTLIQLLERITSEASHTLK